MGHVTSLSSVVVPELESTAGAAVDESPQDASANFPSSGESVAAGSSAVQAAAGSGGAGSSVAAAPPAVCGHIFGWHGNVAEFMMSVSMVLALAGCSDTFTGRVARSQLAAWAGPVWAGPAAIPTHTPATAARLRVCRAAAAILVAIFRERSKRVRTHDVVLLLGLLDSLDLPAELDSLTNQLLENLQQELCPDLVLRLAVWQQDLPKVREGTGWGWLYV
jgi:hypothetical protein